MENSDKVKILKQFTDELIKIIGSHDKSGAEITSIEEFLDFRTSLNQESDRGSVLMAAAFIEDKIAQLIESFLVDNKRVRERMLKGNGALTTFSSKIDMAYLLGLIPENVLNDLHILRKIRNEFAHNASTISFETPSIKDRTNALTVLSKVLLRDNTRTFFLRSMTTILSIIDIKMERFERCIAEQNFDPKNLEREMKIVEETISRKEITVE